MLLEQINRRLTAYASEVKVTKIREAPSPGEFKTIGVRVDSETYALLVERMRLDGVKTMKIAALEAMKRGLR